MKGKRFIDIPAETIVKISQIQKASKEIEESISYIKGSIAEKERKIRVAEDLKEEIKEDHKRLQEQKERLYQLMNERI